MEEKHPGSTSLHQEEVEYPTSDGKAPQCSQKPSSGDVGKLPLADTVDGPPLTNWKGSQHSMPSLIAGWDRYEILSTLGKGGMGSVYKARDRKLGRFVALKFIHGIDPHTTQRFLQEARAQARIQHPGICQVHDVGDIHGQPYIAMEYQPGQTLTDAAREMTLEQKVCVMRDIAEAVHAAHQLGIVHRDLKPGNIMVHRSQEYGGIWHAVVMDFGLACDLQSGDRLTQSGIVMGTPAYMAPEQALGRISQIDRRTDVYSLGAMLYELFSGIPPVVSDTIANALVQVISAEPFPLRRRNPSLPVDLATITHKCLHKEPQSRYQTALALANDLRRYLAGEPIAARRRSIFSRYYIFARKHKLVTAVSSTGIITFLILGMFMIRFQIRQNREIKRAQKLGQDIKEVELFLRYAYALPLHNVDREYAVIRTRMAEISNEFGGRRDRAEGLAEYALGRGALVLGEREAARRHFEAAILYENNSPEVHFALGQTLGELFQLRCDEIRFAGAPSWQEEQRRKFRNELLDPALQHFEKGRGQLLAPESYAAGLVAFYSGKYSEAVKQADATLSTVPWLYEADLLAADSLRALGEAAFLQGHFDVSLTYYQQAALRYRGAREAGTSDPQVYYREAQFFTQMIELDENNGSDLATDAKQALIASESAIVSQPSSLLGYQAKAQALMQTIHYKILYSQEIGDEPEQILNISKAKLLSNPQNYTLNYLIAIANIIKFSYQVEHGQLEENYFREGRLYITRTLQLRPEYSRAYNDWGTALGLRGHFAAKHGEEFNSFFDESRINLRHAIEKDPQDIYPYINMTDLISMQMQDQYNNGKIDFSLLDQANEILQLMQKDKRQDFVGFSYFGKALIPKIMFKISQAEKPDHEIKDALRYFDLALKQNPTFHESYRGRAQVFYLQAKAAILEGKDASNSLREGLGAASRTVELNPNDAMAHAVHAQLYRLAAQNSNGAARELVIKNAEAAALRALNLDATSIEALLVLTQLAELRNRPDEGLLHLAAALKVNPRHAESHAMHARLLTLKAELLHDSHESDRLRAQADQILAHALALNPYLQREYAALNHKGTLESVKSSGVATHK